MVHLGAWCCSNHQIYLLSLESDSRAMRILQHLESSAIRIFLLKREKEKDLWWTSLVPIFSPLFRKLFLLLNVLLAHFPHFLLFLKVQIIYLIICFGWMKLQQIFFLIGPINYCNVKFY